MRRELSEEPDGMSQICGYQIHVSPYGTTYCGEFKGDGLFFCRQHHDWVAFDFEGGIIRMAAGNVRGRVEWQQEFQQREVPRASGDAAIYSVEYLTKREGNALGTEPFDPRSDWLPG